jgi:hypothetical protein
MSLSKSLTSAVAALTVAGAVGIAYAQSTPDTSTQAAPAAADTSQPASNTAPAADASTMPSSTTTTTTNDPSTSSGLESDLQPKADRN